MKVYYSLLVSLLATPAFAFTLSTSTSSNFRGWSSPEIHFQLNATNCPSGVDVSGIIEDAFALWNNVPTSRVKLSMNGTTTSTTFSNPVTIYCDPNFGASTPGAANGSPGSASVLPTTGDQITSGIMYLNASGGQANIGNLSRTVVAVVLAHEIGHLVGLGHSQDVNALMYYDASAKTTLALAQDDIDGISYLYPRNELDGDGPLGCALVKALPPSGTGFPGSPFMLLLVPLAIAYWQRVKLRYQPSRFGHLL